MKHWIPGEQVSESNTGTQSSVRSVCASLIVVPTDRISNGVTRDEIDVARFSWLSSVQRPSFYRALDSYYFEEAR